METDRELLKGSTPTLVLAVLRDGPLHGYAIAREVAERTGNALQFKEGTLYPALHALEQEELLIAEWQTTAGGRERKVYQITPAGLSALERRARTWESFVSAVGQVLKEPANENANQPEAKREPKREPVRRRGIAPA